MIFPNLSPSYLDEKDRPILSRMETFYAESITMNQSFWSEADTDLRFYLGDQSLWNDLYGNLPANRRRQFSFNRIMPIINMIDGHQRRNRKSTIVTPIENGDAETADQFTKVLMWVNQQEGVLETVSDSFKGSLITGMNLLQVWLDYREDPVSGNIRVDNCSYNSFLIDPFFKKSDLSDCNSIWKRSFLTKRQCASLLPEHADQIVNLYGNDQGSARDSKFQFLPESYNYSMKDLLTYDEYYYRDFRTQQMLVDTETGETMEWRSQDKDKLEQFLNLYPQVTTIEQEIPTIRLAIVVQGKVMYHGPQPSGSDFYPFVPVFSYYNPESPYYPYRLQGVVRGLRDAQYLYNRRRIIELDILESQINSGYMYKENALVNPKDIFLSGQGKGLALKEEAQMTDVQKIPSANIDPSLIQLSELLGKEIPYLSGVNEELLGSADDSKAGILSMLRQGAGLTTLQGLFDNLDHAQKLLGKLMIDLIQINFTPGKIKKILEDQEPAPQFYNKAFGKYHAAVEEGTLTTTQKQLQFAQLLQLREVGVPIPDDLLLESATVQNKKQLIDSIQKQQQQQQQALEQQQQLQAQQAEAQIGLIKAQTLAAEGMGVERYSRVPENEALEIERKAKAIQEQDTGFLNVVKAMKELEGMDIAHIQQLLIAANTLKQQEAILAQQNAETLKNPKPIQPAEPAGQSLGQLEGQQAGMR